MSLKAMQEQYYIRGDRIIELERLQNEAVEVLKTCIHYMPEGCKGYRLAKAYVRLIEELRVANA
jgi:hypothetical protein